VYQVHHDNTSAESTRSGRTRGDWWPPTSPTF
jgi:hypothetical protein